MLKKPYVIVSIILTSLLALVSISSVLAQPPPPDPDEEELLRDLNGAPGAERLAGNRQVRPGSHESDPRTQNLHPMGESFEAGSLDPFIANSDLAFWGRLAFAGRYDGFRVIDISAPGNPKEVAQVLCNGAQGDVAVWGNILVRAVDRPQRLPDNDLSRACEGVDTDAAVGETGFEGLQIFVADDWRSVTAENLVAAVPTDCGAHTHTLVPDLANNRLIVYVSVAFSSAFAGPTPYGTTCESPHDRIVAVEIPLDDPSAASVVNNDIPASERGCHDVAAHLGVARLVGACRPNVVVWDISDLANPGVLYETTAPGPTTWHSAALTWDGQVLVMGWEPGGGGRPACQATGTPLDPPIAGNVVQTDEMKSIFFFDASDGALIGTWVLPRPQTATENCTIHNYNVVPLRDRYVLVQGSYQSGTSVVDFTDPANAVEVAWVDPPPIDPEELVLGGVWSSYWYNGFIYEHDILEGFRLYNLSDNVTAGAQRLDHLNPQTQEAIID